MQFRPATMDDVDAIAAMSARVQAWLLASDSLQEFGPIPRATVEAHARAGTAHVLDDGGTPIGGVFVEPAASAVTPLLAQELAALGLSELGERLWWLQKLMVEPDRRGQGLGPLLLAGVQQMMAGHANAVIALDCWAGNTKLREFYAAAGFRLRGEFAADGYSVAAFTWSAAGHG